MQLRNQFQFNRITLRIEFPDAIELAEQSGMSIAFRIVTVSAAHPNTLTVMLHKERSHVRVTGCSIGGGNIEVLEVNGFGRGGHGLAGVRNAIPLDEIIQVMLEVGSAMPDVHRETAKVGLVQTHMEKILKPANNLKQHSAGAEEHKKR